MEDCILKTIPSEVLSLRIGTHEVPYRVAGSGPPLLCSELPLNPFARMSLLQDRLAATHTVYLIDLRTVIGNPAAPPATSLLEFLADFSLRILDELGIGQCRVLGTFMYAGVAMQMAIMAPDRIRQLILIGTLGTQRLPATFWLRASTGVYRLPGFPVLNRSRLFRSLVECIDYAFLGPLRMKELFWNPAQAPICLEDLYEQNKTPEHTAAGFTLMWCIRHMRCDRLAARAGEVKCPALLIHGEEDLWVPLESTRELTSRMPDAKLAAIPQARHAPELDQPELTLRSIEKFLAQFDAGDLVCRR